MGQLPAAFSLTIAAELLGWKRMALAQRIRAGLVETVPVAGRKRVLIPLREIERLGRSKVTPKMLADAEARRAQPRRYQRLYRKVKTAEQNWTRLTAPAVSEPGAVPEPSAW